jgi:hypothetical protein
VPLLWFSCNAEKENPRWKVETRRNVKKMLKEDSAMAMANEEDQEERIGFL